MSQPAFDLGQVVATPEALAYATLHGIDLGGLLARHQSGDCGDTDEDDTLANLAAIVSQADRVFSVYRVGPGAIWLITEWDRSYTTILLPENY